MDTQKEIMMTLSQVSRQLAGRTLVVGAKQLKKALKNGSASCVYLACNADPAITEPLAEACQQSGIALVWVHSMTDLGHACGIEVGAAAAAVTD